MPYLDDDDDHVCHPVWCRALTDEIDPDPVWWHQTPAITYVSIGGPRGPEIYDVTEPLLGAYLNARGIDPL
ncbi:hypothetical protein [Microbacterium sp. CJ88]|uniref:hypothetical protein n=1 Tax=Microbacterium sp. CJ88 TaxID=3445672 RepID=UPI003F6609EA